MGREVRVLARVHVVGIVVALSALIFSAGQQRTFRTHPTESATPADDNVPERDSSREPALRPRYPYSVIPGGVQSAAELQNDLAHDPVAASHYSGFDASKAHVVRLDHDRMAYVSYRMGDRIFWTRQKIKLPEGETVITDGASEARTRCGNRISDVPVDPVSPMEPVEEAFDPPATELFAMLALSPESDPPASQQLFPPSAGGPPSTPPGGGVFIPPPYYPPVGGGGSPSTPPPPPVSVPEPGSLELSALGALILLTANWLADFRRRRPA